MSKKRVLLQLKTLKFPFRKELRFNKSTDLLICKIKLHINQRSKAIRQWPIN